MPERRFPPPWSVEQSDLHRPHAKYFRAPRGLPHAERITHWLNRRDNPALIGYDLNAFLRDHANRPMFYDLYLNFTQLKRTWPTIEITQTLNEVR
jgi:hypothetical protein